MINRAKAWVKQALCAPHGPSLMGYCWNCGKDLLPEWVRNGR